MKIRSELLVTCAALALCAATSVQAADLITKAPVVAPTTWWYEGYAEIGGRFDMNGADHQQLGKFYQYEDLRPGVFGNFYYGQHRTGPDPWDLVFWGTNAGWDDQAFGLEMSKPGTYYLTFGWDETPHVYSNGAQTTYSGIGGNVLSSVRYPIPTTQPNTTAAQLAGAQAVVNANTNIFDLGIRRDTATAAGRWTPTDNWDITADYSHMHREGTQQQSTENTTALAPPSTTATRTSIQLPKPVDDTTQNGSIKAEYNGSSWWDKPFNVAVGYAISSYNDEVGCAGVAGTNQPTAGTNCFTYNNPWVTAPGNAGTSFWNRYPLPPDNSAHTVNVTGGVGLPLYSRYMGTFQYGWMEQDEPFQSSTINPFLAPAVLSRSSLGGDARTTLSNNVLTTQVTPLLSAVGITADLTNTARYRYYDYHSNQDPFAVGTLGFGLWNRPDSNSSGGTAVEIATPMGFNKQNASDELVWRGPWGWKWLNVGAAYEWERWKHTYFDSDESLPLLGPNWTAVTNENAVKGFFDAKWGWSTLRTSVRYSERRLDGNYPTGTADAANSFQVLDLQNRDQTIVKSMWDINVTNTVTVTPNGGYRLDNYTADGVSQNGISQYQSWNVGGDVSWAITPLATVYVSYTHEDGERDVYTNPVSGTPVSSPSRTFLRTHDQDDTIVVGAKYVAIPDKLFLNATYTYSRGISSWAQDCGPTGICASAPLAYPDTTNTNQRIDAQAKYMLDQSLLRNAGLLANTKPYVNFRVIYERNSNDSWQNVQQQLGWGLPGGLGDTTLQKAIFLGMPNPNYNVVIGMVSLGVKW